MKKHVKKNRNKKGSVLLTVVCFTLVCMIIASTALSLASYSAKNSNNNVRSTQAEISAQNFLQEYINSFPDPGDDTRFNALSTLAGSDANNPNVISAKLKDSAGNDVTSVSTDAKIKIYKSGSGIVVRSEVNSNGETEVASAYFDGKATNPYISTNVIETTETANADEFGMKSDGDVHFECKDPTNTIYYTNTQSKNKGDIIVQANFVAGMNTQVTISDSVQPKSDGTGTELRAAKVRVQGWLFWNQANMENVTDATQHTGTAPVDGYVYGENGICFAGSSGGTHVGTSACKVDVYSGGNVYFAKIPEYLPNASNTTITNGERTAIEPMLNGLGCSNKFLSDIGSCAEIYGDLNCAGNLVIANQTEVKVHGNINVSKNIYLLGNAKIDLGEASVNCSGKVIKCDSNGNFERELNQWNNVSNFVSPDSFTDDNKLSIHYKGFSTNEIFEDQFEGHQSGPTGNELGLAEKYKNAWNSTKAPGVDWKDYVFIDENCTISLNDALDDFKANNSWYTQQFNDFAQTQLKQYIDSKISDTNMRYRLWINLGGITTAPKTDGFNFNIDEITTNDSLKKNFKFVLIMPRTGDQVVILPAGNAEQQGNPMLNSTIYVDYSHSNKYTKTGNETNKDYIYDNTYAINNNKQTAENFCYFMVDTGDENGDWYRLGNVWTQEDPTPKTTMPYDPSNQSNTKVFNLAEMTIADITRYPNIETSGQELGNTSVPYSEKMCGNNNFILVPNDGRCFVRSQDEKKCIQAILYGPKSNITTDGPANSRVFIGQAITGSFKNNQCDSECATLLPAPGSIMDTIVANKNNTSVIKLQYFIKSKK